MYEYRVRRIADAKYLLIDDYRREVWVEKAKATVFEDANSAAERCGPGCTVDDSPMPSHEEEDS
jgi:hypothetical protein